MSKNKLIALAGVALVTIASLIISSTRAQDKKIANTEQALSIQKAEKGTIERIVQYSGIIKGEKEVQLSPKISGTISSLLKNEGDFVRAGELLATIDGSEFRAESDLAQENISATEDSLQETEKYYEQLVDEAQSSYEKLKKLYSIAKESGDSSDIAIAKKNLSSAEESVKSAKRLRDLQITSAQGQLGISQKQLGIADAYLNNVRIVAPFSGIISAKNSQLGSLATPGSPIYSLSSSAKKEIEISVAGEEAEKMSVGQKVKISTENQTETEGEIITISPVSDFENRKSNVKISVSPQIRLGTYAQVFIMLEKKDSVILIPTEAIVKKYHENFVYTSENGKAKQIMVTTGLVQNGMTEIISGLSEEDFVITKGQYYLRDGEPIAAQN